MTEYISERLCGQIWNDYMRQTSALVKSEIYEQANNEIFILVTWRVRDRVWGPVHDELLTK